VNDDQRPDDTEPTAIEATEQPAVEAAEPATPEPSAIGAAEPAPAEPAAVESTEPAPAAVEAAEPALSGFAELGLREELLRALNGLGYEEPTPIQRETIEPLLAGRDLLGQAATGTGKTAAFALPILQMLTDGDGRSEPVALVLVPTRELAMQVSEAMYKYGRHQQASVVPVYGGQPIFRQIKALERGVHIVVATPGRAVDLIKRGSLRLDSVRTVVLDEADEMLDMGFAEELEAILAATPVTRQTVLFSATLPPRIDGIARKHLRDPVRIQIRQQTTSADTPPLVEQRAYVVPRVHKAAALGRVIDIEAPTAAIVFCRTRGEVDDLTETLNGRGYRAEALHGGMSQEQRDKVMGRVRSGTAELLIATDVAARGLDIDQLTHVFNFDVPSAPESYVHRIGRIGRAGREGVAITFAEPREQRQLGNIERLTRQKIAIQQVPTVAALRARQQELALDEVRESIAGGDLDRFRAMVEALREEFAVEDVAAAALKLVHEANGPVVEEVEIPDVVSRHERKDRQERGGFEPGGGGYERRARGEKPFLDGPVASIHFDVGRHAGVRPQDLVGAIANETRLSGRQIGKIMVQDRFSIVEVPQDAAQEVIAAMSRTLVRGKRVSARLDRKAVNHSKGSFPKKQRPY
jgi:ATP-dependent RNA helicase DeaD